jgi:hypothetical protein
LIDQQVLICINKRFMAAAAINEEAGRVRRLELLNKIDIEVNINDAILLANEEGLLTALDDRYRVSIIKILLTQLFHI